MKIFSIGLFLLLVFESFEGSTIPPKKSNRALNTSFITDFNGTYQRKDPSTNTEVESSTYKASHEFHHQSSEADWTDYTTKCSNIIKGFLQAIAELIATKCQQNSTFNFNINTTLSQNSDDCLLEGENGTKSLSPKITIQATNCEVPSSCQNYRVVNCIGEYRGGSNQEGVKRIQISGRKYKCFPVCDEEKIEETEIIKPNVGEDEVCSEAPEQEKQHSSQTLAETLLIESTPSNPEFQQTPLTKTTEITEVEEIITPKTENGFVPTTTFIPTFDTFESQTETFSDTKTVENIKKPEFPVDTFPTTSTYYDEEVKGSEKFVTELPLEPFSVSPSGIPSAQYPAQTSETVTEKATEEIPAGGLIASEIPVTVPPQPTTLSATYNEEMVQTSYQPTPEPTSQFFIPQVPQTQTQASQTLVDQTIVTSMPSESNAPLSASQTSQYETTNEPEVVLPYVEQTAPQQPSQTESVTEEVYQYETSTPQPPSPVILEAPLVIPQTEPKTESVTEEVYQYETSTPQPSSPVTVEAPLFIPQNQPEYIPSEDQIASQPEIVLPYAEQTVPQQPSETESVTDEVYQYETSTPKPSVPVTVGAPLLVPQTEPKTESVTEEVYQYETSTPQPSVPVTAEVPLVTLTPQTETQFISSEDQIANQPEVVLPYAEQTVPQQPSETGSVTDEVYRYETSTPQPSSPVIVEAPLVIPQTEPKTESVTEEVYQYETSTPTPRSSSPVTVEVPLIMPQSDSQTKSVTEEVYQYETSTPQPSVPVTAEVPLVIPQTKPKTESVTEEVYQYETSTPQPSSPVTVGASLFIPQNQPEYIPSEDQIASQPEVVLPYAEKIAPQQPSETQSVTDEVYQYETSTPQPSVPVTVGAPLLVPQTEPKTESVTEEVYQYETSTPQPLSPVTFEAPLLVPQTKPQVIPSEDQIASQPEVVLPYAEQTVPQQSSETGSMTEEVYQYETSAPQPLSPVTVEAPLITPQTDSQTKSVTEEVYQYETSTPQPSSPLIVEAPLVIPQTEPQFLPSEDQTLVESDTETLKIQQPIQEPQITPEVQPVTVVPATESTTTEKLETEKWDEEYPSGPAFLPSAPETEVRQVDESNYDTFQEYSSTPIPFAEQTGSYQEKTVETVTLSPEVESVPEAPLLTTQAPTLKETYTEEVVETDKTSPAPQPLPETRILPSFPSEKPQVLTSTTSEKSSKDDVYLLEPETNAEAQPSTTQTNSEIFDYYQTSPSPDYDFYGQLSNKNFPEMKPDSLVTEAPVQENVSSAPQVQSDYEITISAKPVPEYRIPYTEQSTPVNTPTTLPSKSEERVETYNGELSTPLPLQPQPLPVDDKNSVASEFIDSNQKSEPKFFLPVTEQPDIITKNTEIIEKDVTTKEYTTPAPSVQPVELLITPQPQPQPSYSTFYEEDIIETRTPAPETASAPLVPAEIVSFTYPPQEEQSLSLSQSNVASETNSEQIPEAQPSLVPSQTSETSSTASDQAFYPPLTSEPVGEVVPEYPNQPTLLNEQVVATEYNDYSTPEPQVPANDYVYETQQPLEFLPTTQSPLTAETQQEELLSENISTSETEYATEEPQYFTRPPVDQGVVNAESQTLANEYVEEQIATTSSPVVEENVPVALETEPLLPSPSDESSTFNEYFESEVTTATPEQSLDYDLAPEFEEQKPKEVVISEAEEVKKLDNLSTPAPFTPVPEEQPKPFVTYEPEFPVEQPVVSPVWPSPETQTQTENVTYFQDVVTEQYQPNDQQFETSTPYPEEPVPVTQPEVPYETGKSLSQSQIEETFNYSEKLSGQNIKQPQLDIPVKPPHMEHKPFVDFDELTTPNPGATVYEDQPFSIQYQTSIGPQSETDTTVSYYDEDTTTKYSTIPPQPIPVVYPEQKVPLIGPQNFPEETFVSEKSEISTPLEQQKTVPSTSETSTPFYNQETDYSYSETASTPSVQDLDYYSEPFVPTLSPVEQTTTPFETSVTEQSETFDQKPQTLPETPLPEETQILEKSTESISYPDDLVEQGQIPVVPNTEKEIVESYDQDFTTTASYKPESESTTSSQTKVVEEIEKSSYEPFIPTPPTEAFLPVELPQKPEGTFDKEYQSTTVSQNTENLERVPVEESPYLPYSDAPANFEFTQTTDEQYQQSFSTLPPQVQYPAADLKSSSLLSDQLSQESFSNAYSTPGISKQPLEVSVIPEQPTTGSQISDSEIIKSLPEGPRVPEESRLDSEKTEASNYEASTSKSNSQTSQTQSSYVEQTENVQQFSNTYQQFGTTTPQIEIEIYYPRLTTQMTVLNETVESTTTTASQNQDVTASYSEKEQQVYNVPTTPAPEVQTELPVVQPEQTQETKTIVSESAKPSDEIFDQYSDVNNYSEPSTSSFQEIDSIATTTAPQEKPIPAYDATLLTVPPASQTSFSNYEDESIAYDTLPEQTQLPGLVTSPPLPQTSPEESCTDCEVPSVDTSTQESVTPLPETVIEPSGPVVTDSQTEILGKSDYDYEEITTNPAPVYEQNFVPTLTEKNSEVSETTNLKEFTETTTPAPFYDENQSFTQEVFESQDRFQSTTPSAEYTPYVSVIPKSQPQYPSSIQNFQSNEFSSTPLPPSYAPTPEESKLSDSQLALEEQREETFTEKPLDYMDQGLNNGYVTSESLVKETTKDTSVVPESQIVPIPIGEQPLSPKPELSQPVIYDEVPREVANNAQETFYSYDDLSTTTSPGQQPPYYDNQPQPEPEPVEEHQYLGPFQQFNVKNTVSDSLVTETVTNEQPSMIYDTTLSPESASESFQTVVQLNSTFTPQPQVNEPVYQPSFLPAQPQLSTEHLSTTSETLTTPIPKSNEEPCDEGETDTVTTPPVVSDSQFTENVYNEELSFADSQSFVTEKPEFKPEILVTQPTPNVASQSQSVVNDEIVRTDTYFPPTSTVVPVGLPSSQQTQNDFSTEKQFSEVYEQVTTEKPPAAFVPLPIAYPVNASQIPTQQTLSSESQTILLDSSQQPQPDTTVFYDYETITGNNSFTSAPVPSQPLNEAPLVTAVPVIPPSNKFVEVDEEIVSTTKTPETQPQSFATLGLVTTPLPPQPTQQVEVDEETVSTTKTQETQPQSFATVGVVTTPLPPQPTQQVEVDEETVSTTKTQETQPQSFATLGVVTTPLAPQSKQVVEVDEETVSTTKTPETQPQYFATIGVVPSTLPPRQKQLVEVDEEILFSNKNPEPVKHVTVKTLPNAGPIPSDFLYFQEEIVTTKTTPSSSPQTTVPLKPLAILPTTTQTLPVPSSTGKIVEVDQEIITSKYPSMTPQPLTTPTVFDEKFAPETIYSTPLTNEGKNVAKEIVIVDQPTVSQEQYVTPSSVESLPPVVTTPAPSSLPKKFTEVNEEMYKQSTPNVPPFLLSSLAPAPLPQGVSEVDEEVIITTNQPMSPQVQSALPAFLQPLPSSLAQNQTSSFDKTVTPTVPILPPGSEPKKFVEIDQEIVITGKEPVSQTTLPPFIQPLIPLQSTLAPGSLPNGFKEVDEEIIITTKPVDAQQKPTTPLIETTSPVATTLAPSSSTKQFSEVDEKIIASGKQPVPTLPPFLASPVPDSFALGPSTNKFMEVDEEYIITSKPTTPQSPAVPSSVSPITPSTSAPPTEKLVEEFIINNNNPTSPPPFKYSDDLSQTQSTGIPLASLPLNPQTQQGKVTYFNQEVITTTAAPNNVPLQTQTDAYIPLQPVQPIPPQLQSQTIDYYEQEPQTKTFGTESPAVTSFPTVTNSPQEMYPNAGVSVAQVDTSSQQPVPYDLVPEQTIPSSKPGEDSCSCCKGSSAPLLCPFNPALKGNMSAPSYYILVSKIPNSSNNGEQSFQVERVFLGDGTPLNCTLTDKTFPTSLYKPIPIASSRPVTLQTTYDYL